MADALSLLGCIDPLLRSYVFVSLKDAEIQITRMDRLRKVSWEWEWKCDLGGKISLESEWKPRLTNPQGSEFYHHRMFIEDDPPIDFEIDGFRESRTRKGG